MFETESEWREREDMGENDSRDTALVFNNY